MDENQHIKITIKETSTNQVVISNRNYLKYFSTNFPKSLTFIFQYVIIIVQSERL